MAQNYQEMRKDGEWSVIDGEPCRVIEFIPAASVQNGKVLAPNKTEPYASVILECRKIPNTIKGYICHKMDFQHLWAAFMPRLWVKICQKGAFELMSNPNSRPELQGEARYLAERPIVEWKPEVME